jgi:replicative DNA helicase
VSAEIVTLDARRRMPPSHADTTAERDLLGCIMLDPERLDEVLDILRPADFADRRARLVWEAMTGMREQGVPIGLDTVHAELVALQTLATVSEEYLVSLCEVLPTPDAVESHARRIRGYAQTRAVVSAAQGILVAASRGVEDAEVFAAEAETAIVRAAQERSDVAGPVDARTCVIEVVEALTRAAEQVSTGQAVDGVIPTRFAALNSMLGGGFRPSELHLIAGRPGMGKTAIGLDIALSLAEHQPGIVYSLEMSRGELVRRALASLGGVDSGRMRSATMSHDDWGRAQTAGAKLADLPLHIDDTPGATLMHIRATARRQRARSGLGWILIDYLQLMRHHERLESREVTIGEISRGLKQLAKELGIPILALAQLNRDVEKRSGKDRRPQLSDLRDSGSLEQDADTVMFVHREEMFRRDEPELRGLAELIIGKQRSGPTGIVPLRYVAECTRFETREPDVPEAPPIDAYDDFGDFAETAWR